MTFVRTKLLLERMTAGATATVLLRGAEPLANVPRAVAAQGHAVLELISPTDPTGVHRLRLRKREATDPAS